ncbi:MAG: LamG-like jellyroll fold domain-containing protein [Planctomycetota bacterium]
MNNEPTQALEAYFAGHATDEQLRAIEAWLHADPANAKAFMQQLHFRELLGEHLREQRSETGSVLAELAQLEAAAQSETVTFLGELPAKENTPLSTHDFKEAGRYLFEHYLPPRVVATVAAAVVLLLGVVLTVVVLTVVLLPGNETPNDIAEVPDFVTPAPDTNRVVATLIDTVDASWVGDLPALDEGFMKDQIIELTGGLARVRFANQTELVLEAPCKISFLSESSIHLIQGSMVGRCQMESSKGFVVYTDSAQIVDVGTEFGVVTNALGETITQVFDGEVELTGMSNGQLSNGTMNVFAGQAMQVDQAGIQIVEADPNALSFIRNRHYEAISNAGRATDLDRWMTQSLALRRDRGVVLYYAFDNETSSTITLPNLATRNRGYFKGIINGASWTDGRFPGKRGLMFNSSGPSNKLGQHVEVHNSDSEVFSFQQQSFSVAVWFKHEPLRFSGQEEDVYIPVITKGENSWRLHSYSRSSRITWDTGVTRHYNQLESLSELFDGKWHFIVAVNEVNRQTGDASQRLYVDGQKIETNLSVYRDGETRRSATFINEPWHEVAPVLIGANSEKPERRFNGIVDELVLFDRALTPDEILALHEYRFRPIE